MNTGGGTLFSKIRPEFIPGGFVTWFVQASHLGEDGGAPLDAPDYYAAGSMLRHEEWCGTEGFAYPEQSLAFRSRQ